MKQIQITDVQLLDHNGLHNDVVDLEEIEIHVFYERKNDCSCSVEDVLTFIPDSMYGYELYPEYRDEDPKLVEQVRRLSDVYTVFNDYVSRHYTHLHKVA